jgi:hypothetical protein
MAPQHIKPVFRSECVSQFDVGSLGINDRKRSTQSAFVGERKPGIKTVVEANERQRSQSPFLTVGYFLSGCGRILTDFNAEGGAPMTQQVATDRNEFQQILHDVVNDKRRRSGRRCSGNFRTLGKDGNYLWACLSLDEATVTAAEKLAVIFDIPVPQVVIFSLEVLVRQIAPDQFSKFKFRYKTRGTQLKKVKRGWMMVGFPVDLVGDFKRFRTREAAHLSDYMLVSEVSDIAVEELYEYVETQGYFKVQPENTTGYPVASLELLKFQASCKPYTQQL